ncbi:MAG: hypothetical protein JEZ06_13145, partial [Anaerolineaceae bacterium]|nr:hypothetical protein [Anaerolineaceae bacterium]
AGSSEELSTLLNEVEPGEDIYYATDQWLSALETLQGTCGEIIQQVRDMLQQRAINNR